MYKIIQKIRKIFYQNRVRLLVYLHLVILLYCSIINRYDREFYDRPQWVDFVIGFPYDDFVMMGSLFLPILLSYFYKKDKIFALVAHYLITATEFFVLIPAFT